MRGDSLNPEALGLTTVGNFGMQYNAGNGPASVAPSTHTQKRRIRLTDKIVATQPFVIDKKIKDMPERTPGNRPDVRRQDGKTFVVDGHHRIAKALKRGQKSITVNEYLS